MWSIFHSCFIIISNWKGSNISRCSNHTKFLQLDSSEVPHIIQVINKLSRKLQSGKNTTFICWILLSDHFSVMSATLNESLVKLLGSLSSSKKNSRSLNLMGFITLMRRTLSIDHLYELKSFLFFEVHSTGPRRTDLHPECVKQFYSDSGLRTLGGVSRNRRSRKVLVIQIRFYVATGDPHWGDAHSTNKE